jgi:hypothetical protein
LPAGDERHRQKNSELRLVDQQTEQHAGGNGTPLE